MLLAIDPATSTGWALEDKRSGQFSIRCAGKGLYRDIDRVHRWQMRFCDLLTDLEPSEVVCEFSGARGWTVPRQLTLAAGTICRLRELPFVYVTPRTWESWATKAGIWCKEAKSDVADAKAILAWRLAHR